ncbi:MAG: serine hydrolase domain-containing protein [Candidatus Methylomirabilaceae bacterium]
MLLLAVTLVGVASPDVRGQARPSCTVLADRAATYTASYRASLEWTGAILVIRGECTLLRGGFGLSNQIGGVANTPNTRFRLGQLSEHFTAAAILLLEQRGRLSTTDRLTKFLPGLAGAASITIDQLLAHRAGLRNPRDPLAGYSYSTPDYVYLAKVIQVVSGQTYGDFLRDNLFKPLGMVDTGNDNGTVAIGSELAQPYAAAGARSVAPARTVQWAELMGSASLYSTVDDLGRWARSLSGGSPLGPSARRKLLGTARRVDIDLRAPGVEACLEVLPSDRIVVVVLSNVYSSLGHGLADDLVSIARGETPTSPAPSRAESVPDATLARYVGRYQLGDDYFEGATVLEVTRVHGDLALHARGFSMPAFLVPFDEIRFLDRLYGGIVTFEVDARGGVTGLAWQRSRLFVARRLK